MNRLGDMTWTDLDGGDRAAPDGGGGSRAAPDGGGRVLLVPVGSTEQHGPHLPLSTDTDLACAVAALAARRLPHAIVAPAVPYGASGEHQAFPGTLSIGNAATEELLVELGRSAGQTFPGLCFISTHGGNAGALQRAVERLRSEQRSVQGWSPTWEGDAHAGHTETSLMLVVAPDRVRLDAAAAGDTRPLIEILADLRQGRLRSLSPNGVLGDPRDARPDDGRNLLHQAVGELVSFVRHAFPVPAPGASTDPRRSEAGS